MLTLNERLVFHRDTRMTVESAVLDCVVLDKSLDDTLDIVIHGNQTTSIVGFAPL